jgi:hypothetical protein
MVQQPHTPVVVREVGAPTPQANVGELIVGSIGLTGVILIAALVVGLLAGAIVVSFRKRRDADADHARLNLSS